MSIAGKPLDVQKDAALVRVHVDLDVDPVRPHLSRSKLALINGKDFESGTPMKVEASLHTSLEEEFFEGAAVLEPVFRHDIPPSSVACCYAGC